jgi:NhaP-type Na+/H+ or K+/H+ antiporter
VLLCRDPTLTTIVTLLSAYSSYYVADRLVGASGLLAVVMNGFTMSLIGESVSTNVSGLVISQACSCLWLIGAVVMNGFTMSLIGE